MYKFGYVSILGKPNAGKSTLTNALVGEKVSIISSKPQTTRNNVLGIVNGENYQIAIVDTPGIHSSKNKLDRYMLKNIRTASSDVDIIVYMIDASRKVADEELGYLSTLANKEIPIILVINKIDATTYEKTYPLLDKLSKMKVFKEILPISAKDNRNIDELIKMILSYLPECSGPQDYAYPIDEYTDKSLRFLIAEIVREKALNHLDEEIPHGIATTITEFVDTDKCLHLETTIYCEKDSHKNIIIGKNGSKAKVIGEESRKDIEALVGKKVMLKLWVRVKDNWRDNLNYLSEIGYNDNEEN